jgi:hypothetical protein
MAKDKARDRDRQASARGQRQPGSAAEQRTVSASDAAGAQHHAAQAHGRPARIDKSLPADREALIALHAEARGRRSAAPLGSEAFRAAVDEIARIEIRIADVDRGASPPRG